MKSAEEILEDELSENYWSVITEQDDEGHTTFKDWIIEAMEVYASQFRPDKELVKEVRSEIKAEHLEKMIEKQKELIDYLSKWLMKFGSKSSKWIELESEIAVLEASQGNPDFDEHFKGDDDFVKSYDAPQKPDRERVIEILKNHNGKDIFVINITKSIGIFEAIADELLCPVEFKDEQAKKEVCNYWMPDKGTSATRCKNCGHDRWEHEL